MEPIVETFGATTVVTLTEDRLDAAMAVRFKEVMKTITDQGADHVILNLGNVGFMDSSGLGAVVAHLKYMGVERVFEIADLTPTVEKVFKLTRMDNVFRIYPSLDDALSAANEQAS